MRPGGSRAVPGDPGPHVSLSSRRGGAPRGVPRATVGRGRPRGSTVRGAELGPPRPGRCSSAARRLPAPARRGTHRVLPSPRRGLAVPAPLCSVPVALPTPLRASALWPGGGRCRRAPSGKPGSSLSPRLAWTCVRRALQEPSGAVLSQLQLCFPFALNLNFVCSEVREVSKARESLLFFFRREALQCLGCPSGSALKG